MISLNENHRKALSFSAALCLFVYVTQEATQLIKSNKKIKAGWPIDVTVALDFKNPVQKTPPKTKNQERRAEIQSS